MPILSPPSAAPATQFYNAATPVVYAVGQLISQFDFFNTNSTSTVLGGYMISLYPFEVRRTISINTLECFVVTAGTSTGNLGLYTSRTSGEPLPATLLTSVSAVPITSTGTKTNFITAVQLTPGLYWFAFQTNNATTGALRGNSANTSRSITGWSGISGTCYTRLDLAAASSGFPADISASTFTGGSGASFGVWAQISAVS